jgi:hypothetical protein
MISYNQTTRRQRNNSQHIIKYKYYVSAPELLKLEQYQCAVRNGWGICGYLKAEKTNFLFSINLMPSGYDQYGWL